MLVNLENLNKKTPKIRTIFWDFDGVILDSQKIRIFGFEEIFKNFDKKNVEALISYHITNGGLSRFHKIEYFFKEILKQEISQAEIQNYANKFSEIMRKNLMNKDYIITETLTFIQNNYKKYDFHIVSGSEENELKFLCENLDLSKYFKSINGSPTKKPILLKNLLQTASYSPQECIMIGDSIHDFYAARDNEINFYGYNNETLRDKARYIDDFTTFSNALLGQDSINLKAKK